MSDQLQVSVDRMREVSRFVADRADEISAGVKRLDRTVGGELLSGGWQGKAASAYDESWLEWREGADKIVEALQRSADALADAAQLYESEEMNNTAAVQRAGNGL